MCSDLTGNENERRRFLKLALTGTAAIGGAATGLFTDIDTGTVGATVARAEEKDIKMVFIQYLAHSVQEAFSKGISEVLSSQPNISYQQLDGQSKVEVQISLMDTVISQGVSAIFIAPVDSVAIAPSIAKAKRSGIHVITLNVDASEMHTAHVEMSHYFGAKDIAKTMGTEMGGKGKLAILNAPPGNSVRDQRNQGFMDGLKEFHPAIEVVADQVADWDRKKAQDVIRSILAAHPDLGGVFGVNDSMALGAVDVAKEMSLLNKVVVFGDDGEIGALESIAAGELRGTQYTDVFLQGRLAAGAAVALTSAGVEVGSLQKQGHILMPYLIVNKETVGQISSSQRW